MVTYVFLSFWVLLYCKKTVYKYVLNVSKSINHPPFAEVVQMAKSWSFWVGKWWVSLTKRASPGSFAASTATFPLRLGQARPCSADAKTSIKMDGLSCGKQGTTVPPPLPSPHQTRYHRFTVMFESPSEDSLVFNVDSCEDAEAATVVESLKVVNSGDG